MIDISKFQGNDGSEEHGSPHSKISEELTCHKFRVEFLRVTDPNTTQGTILHSAVRSRASSPELSREKGVYLC